MLVLGDNAKRLHELFDFVQPMAEIGHPYEMDQEHFTLYWVMRPRGWTLQSAWPALKKFS